MFNAAQGKDIRGLFKLSITINRNLLQIFLMKYNQNYDYTNVLSHPLMTYLNQ